MFVWQIPVDFLRQEAWFDQGVDTCTIMIIKKPKNLLDFSVRTHFKRHGYFLTAFRVFYRLMNKLLFLKIYVCIAIKSNKIKNMHYDANDQFQLTLINPGVWDRIPNLKEYWLNENFLNKAISKNDICLGFLDNGHIASYTWYAKETTDLYDGELKIKFNHSYVYAARTFTNPNYRGKRLHALGIEQGLKWLSEKKYKGIVGIVEAINFGSLKGISHFGCEEFGKYIFIKILGKYHIISIGNNKKYGLEVTAC